MRTIIVAATLIFSTAAFADWSTKADDLAKEVIADVKSNSKGEMTADDSKTLEAFAECVGVNLTAKMDKYRCEKLKGPVSDSFNACQNKNPMLRQEGGMLMISCMQSAIENSGSNP